MTQPTLDFPPVSKPSCSIEGCERLEYRHRSLCQFHYRHRLKAGKTCDVEGCNEPEHCKGYCSLHYRLNLAERAGVCTVEGCDRPARGRGICGTHAERLRRRGTLEIPPRVPLIAKCSVASCAYIGRLRRGWCGLHYDRWRQHGDPLYKRPTAEDRFWALVNKNGPIPEHRPELGPCWLWRSRGSTGYGSFSLGTGKSIAAHRYAYELLVHSIPDGLQVDHLCHHPDWCDLGTNCPHRRCVNPAHLEPVPAWVNLMRSGSIQAWHAARTRRREGGDYVPESTVVCRDGRRYRASGLGWPIGQTGMNQYATDV